MLVTLTEFASFSGVNVDNTDLQKIYIGSATDVINGYLGFNVEATENTNPFYADDSLHIPDIVKFVCLEIASLMQLEENNNLGVSSANFSESGSRSFLNVVDYTRYLDRLAKYRVAEKLV